MISTSVVKNTATFSEEFWAELLELSKKAKRKPFECISAAEDVEQLKDCAFSPDHYEHMGSWLHDKRVAPLLKWYKVSGEIILSYEGDLGGWLLVDGKIIDSEVEVRLVPLA